MPTCVSTAASHREKQSHPEEKKHPDSMIDTVSLSF